MQDPQEHFHVVVREANFEVLWEHDLSFKEDRVTCIAHVGNNNNKNQTKMAHPLLTKGSPRIHLKMDERIREDPSENGLKDPRGSW